MAKEQILYFLPAIISALLSGGGGGGGGDGPYDETHPGHATYYLEADGTGSCMLEALPEPHFVGALNSLDYYTPLLNGTSSPNATLCGAYARVTGNKGSVVIKIVDLCPDDICERGHIDLSLEAFSEIDNPALGYVPITWQLIGAPITGAVRFRYKDGSNQWWTAIQVRNHKNPIAKLEVQMGGDWKELPRKHYNYFVAENGVGKGHHTYRVTDIFGYQLIERSSVYLDASLPNPVDWQGKGQFPLPDE